MGRRRIRRIPEITLILQVNALPVIQHQDDGQFFCRKYAVIQDAAFHQLAIQAESLVRRGGGDVCDLVAAKAESCEFSFCVVLGANSVAV